MFFNEDIEKLVDIATDYRIHKMRKEIYEKFREIYKSEIEGTKDDDESEVE